MFLAVPSLLYSFWNQSAPLFTTYNPKILQDEDEDAEEDEVEDKDVRQQTHDADCEVPTKRAKMDADPVENFKDIKTHDSIALDIYRTVQPNDYILTPAALVGRPLVNCSAMDHDWIPPEYQLVRMPTSTFTLTHSSSASPSHVDNANANANAIQPNVSTNTATSDSNANTNANTNANIKSKLNPPDWGADMEDVNASATPRTPPVPTALPTEYVFIRLVPRTSRRYDRGAITVRLSWSRKNILSDSARDELLCVVATTRAALLKRSFAHWMREYHRAQEIMPNDVYRITSWGAFTDMLREKLLEQQYVQVTRLLGEAQRD